MTENTSPSTNPGQEICPASDLARRVQEATGVNAMECYQCGKCSAGCPLLEVTDLMPHDLWRLIQLGAEDRIKNSKHLWLCISCETCSTRCPNQLPLPAVLDFFRQEIIKDGQTPTEENVLHFHNAFLDTVKKKGRLSEVGMVQKYKLASGEYFKDMKLGMSMFFKGKIKLFSQSTAAKNEIRDIFKEAGK